MLAEAPSGEADKANLVQRGWSSFVPHPVFGQEIHAHKRSMHTRDPCTQEIHAHKRSMHTRDPCTQEIHSHSRYWALAPCSETTGQCYDHYFRRFSAENFCLKNNIVIQCFHKLVLFWAKEPLWCRVFGVKISLKIVTLVPILAHVCSTYLKLSMWWWCNLPTYRL
jgi:hypothetical protein